MLYIPNPSNDPAYNQAFEEFVFTSYRSEDVLLLWRNALAVVCGSYQNVFAEVNVPAAQEQGIAIVRRPSGGGAVFHDLGNINYTLIQGCPPGEASYARFLEPVIAALNRIGVPAAMNRTSDIAIGGLKISGSAQRMSKGRVMHHGTLLYSCDLRALASVTRGQRAYFETKGIPSVPWPVTNIIDHMPDRSLSAEAFMDRLLEAFAQVFPIRTHRMTQEEERQVQQLADDKYRTWEWTYGKSPPFTYRRDFCWNGETLQVCFSAVKGVIREISCTPEDRRLSAALTGARLDVPGIRAALLHCGAPGEWCQYFF